MCNQHKIAYPPTSTQKLKLLFVILQCRSNFRSVLAKIQAGRLVKSCFLYPSNPCGLSNSKPRTCILHHFAFLDWLKARDFSSPISYIWPLKPHFLTAVLPHLAMCFIALKGFVYTIAVDFYAFLSCI